MTAAMSTNSAPLPSPIENAAPALYTSERSFSHFAALMATLPWRVSAVPWRATRVGITQSNMSTPRATHSAICVITPRPITLVFDECLPWPCDRARAEQSVATTLAWAKMSQEAPHAPGQLVFGIVQGGIYDDIRRHCAEELAEMAFPGYAIGGGWRT